MQAAALSLRAGAAPESIVIQRVLN
jgi:hypothetical protein